jgi:hypothetical protein
MAEFSRAALPSPGMSRAPSNTVTLAFRVCPTTREDHATAKNRLAKTSRQNGVLFTRSIVASFEIIWFKKWSKSTTRLSGERKSRL